MMRTKLLTKSSTAALTIMLWCSLPHGASGIEDPSLSLLDNGQIRIGIDLRQGGSIGYLADAKTKDNVVNTHDFGRAIGQSYYSGPQPFGVAHPGWPNWPWNPVSAGDVYGHASRVIEHRNDGRVLYVKTTPQQWALNHVAAQCTFETWISLDGRTAQVRNRLTNHRSDTVQYAARDQELPAVYTVGTLHRLVTYDGDRPYTNAPLSEIPKQPAGPLPQWSSFRATEHWAALVDEHDWGLGICHPGVVRFLGGFYGKPGAGTIQDDPTGYLAPLRREILDHNIIYEYQYVLILDTVAKIRQYASDHRPSQLPDYQFANDRQHWWLLRAKDSGSPIRGRLRIELDQDHPQMIGPEALWDAQDVPLIHICAAYKTRATTARLLWTTTELSEFHADRSMPITIQPDGQLRTYSVNLAASPLYRGKITGLRFDPVESGVPGDWVEVVSISCKR